MNFTISTGFNDVERPLIARLYWEAFVAKLSVVLGPESKALEFIAAHLNPAFALVARAPDNAVLGVAGFKTAEGSLIDGGLRDLASVYGWGAMCWRAPLLALVERDLKEGVLLMDGICVTTQARGLGMGTALLRAIKNEAVARRLTSVRLDVIDTNTRARALYEREGFNSIGTQTLGPLRWIFGFHSSTKMLWTAPDMPRRSELTLA